MENNIVDEKNELESKSIDYLSGNLTNQVEVSDKKEKDGIIVSIMSLLLSSAFWWYIIIIINIFWEAYNGTEMYGAHLFIGIFGVLVAPVTILSFGLGIFSIIKYYHVKREKSLFRNILNILNIITSILIGICLLLVCMFILYIFLVLFLL